MFSLLRGNILSLIDFSFPEDQANIVVELVEPFIIPNSIYSAELTDAAIEEARQSVEPVIRSFVTGETLVRLGSIIREVEWEALQRFGLIQPSDQWQDFVGAGMLTILITILISLYHKHVKEQDVDFSVKAVLLVAVIFLFFLGIARFFVLDRITMPYFYPLAAFGLTLSIIFNVEVAIILSLVLAVMTGYGLPNGFDLTIFYILPTILGMLTLGRARRIGAFFFSGLTIGLAGIAIILGYRLPDAVTDWRGIVELSGASLINGIGAASLTLLLQYIFPKSWESQPRCSFLISQDPIIHYCN
jgi:cyclic-di-AMP phosphodiesterase PgpH